VRVQKELTHKCEGRRGSCASNFAETLDKKHDEENSGLFDRLRKKRELLPRADQ